MLSQNVDRAFFSRNGSRPHPQKQAATVNLRL
jgi:hypothetical protein